MKTSVMQEEESLLRKLDGAKDKEGENGIQVRKKWGEGASWGKNRTHQKKLRKAGKMRNAGNPI